MPSKQIYVKPYQVKGHWRTLHTRTFKFICAHCDREATRTTYATACPKYCDECKHLKQKLGKKKAPSGEVLDPSSTSKDTQKPSSARSQTPDIPQKSGSTIKPDRTSTSKTLIGKTAPTPQTSKKVGQPNASGRDKKPTERAEISEGQSLTEPQAAAINLELDLNKLVEYTNQLFLIHYNKGLNSDSKYILIDLWSNKDYQEIESSRGIKTKTIRKITSNLLAQLSNALGEKVHLRNLREVMNKHYRAYHSLSL